MRFVRYWVVFCLCSLVAGGLSGCSGGDTRTTDPAAAAYLPTPPHIQDVGGRLVGPVVYTIDARSKEIWMYFDFSQGSVVPVQNPKTDAWDLAFQRYVIKTNGGDTNPAGNAALSSLGERDFATVRRVPDSAEFTSDVRPRNRLYSFNPVIEKWYNYSYMANVLAPKPVVYLVRTQEGHYARMRILSYYCKDNIAGCLTFEYVYQGDGSTNLAMPG